jgi:CRISPR-associated endonuclease/helicase Cas3
MSKVKRDRDRPYNFGRVFFPGDPNPIPDEVLFQPLGNHVGNVMKLVRDWNQDNFPGESSFERVLEAAKIHDQGKPQRFAITVKTDSQGKFKNYIYSFKGHRFLAESKDAWAQYLARGHHDFSVGDICRDSYILKKKYQTENEQLLHQDPLAYAKELYILEMCDQIEAELACRIIGDENQAESRAFMDFTIAQDGSKLEYYIDPWPFAKDSIELKFESWAMRLSDLSEDEKKPLHKCVDEKPAKDLGKTLEKIVKDWWQSKPEEKAKQTPKTAILKPYPPLAEPEDNRCEFWYRQLAGFQPNPMQKEMFEALAEEAPAILLKAPTGTGKLESVLFAALAHNYRLFLPLPARSLLEDQKQRVEEYLKKFSQLYPGKEFSLVVDTGSQMHRWVYQDGQEIKRRINPRRHLYKGNVILTTIDKFLYRYFAFGDKQKSFIFPLRIHQEKSLICFDEAHSYDDLAFTNFSSLVRSLHEAGRAIVLMTATMPPQHQDLFDYLRVMDYIADAENGEKIRQFQQQTLNQSCLNQKSFQWLSEIRRNPQDPKDFQVKFAEIILNEWKADSDRRIIAVVETVKDAVAIYQQVKHELGSHSDAKKQFLFLYHGRISDQPADCEFSRNNVYKRLKHRDNSNQSYILITTSAIEVGCDLNSQILISEICPPENLIQRAGRCNRRGDVENAKVIVLGDNIQNFANTLSDKGWENYQETLRSLTEFDSQKICECIAHKPHVDDYRVVELFSMLQDYVYQADLTCQPAHDKGLIITRSWTPSVTLVYDDGSHQEDIEKLPQISVPIDRFIIKYSEKSSNHYANVKIYERYYNQEETRWDMRDLTWGFAYHKDIIIKITKTHNSATLPDNLPEYPYAPELGFVELPGLFIKTKSAGFEEKLLYQFETANGKKSVIIRYIKALETSS